MNEGEHVMRRVYGMSLAALCIVLVSGLGVGCFWSSDEPTTVASETTVISSESSSTTEAGTTATSAAVTTTVPSNLVDGLPREYVESLGERPMVILFYVPGGVDDERVLTSVRELQSTYSNYTFLIYQYDLPAQYGVLPTELGGVQYPPQVILVDRQGAIQRVWTGYVDKATLNQTLQDLGRY